MAGMKNKDLSLLERLLGKRPESVASAKKKIKKAKMTKKQKLEHIIKTSNL